ncbi:DUF2127 domain-containing protein [Vibrio aestuarianus]|uniref:DUF2127 domain-containing protein n=1 Tax=Vibrio aestuarianus TaxID=28171 RepID=UPI001446E770|nr:DUF2127 domain-containing protein [Vibrio aestuarianus]MDE1213377.1 DUF2127 domain-containing protein [Vibrio aestuarianus]MDE1217641.1 DUF2127 domain-containing protein [Vibrio aestuarianus]MDE1260444.1 DUF2127 domain-containing protein [Vibrio aestuarianus]MDE1267294.1 DUF2127 domain-containing protein [Vibrio aestuarianus]MDE1274740.1 DUF2127 domain-containing protein [Vibrio aestuarianus]
MTSSKSGLKAVATLEAFKGLCSLLVAFGLHTLAGRNLQQVAESIVSHAHLNPASHLPSVFIHAASTFSDSSVGLAAIGAFAYSLIRFVEAYGLWKGLVWVEWFALVSGAIYIPFEIYEIIIHTSMLGISIFILNIIVVWYMAGILLSKRKEFTYLN